MNVGVSSSSVASFSNANHNHNNMNNNITQLLSVLQGFVSSGEDTIYGEMAARAFMNDNPTIENDISTKQAVVPSTKFRGIGLESWTTTRAYYMDYMFQNATSFDGN
jgi:hypothetical protein